jgi:putative toxin-antitoxin system antitoxin component (TIGR02293 family)
MKTPTPTGHPGRPGRGGIPAEAVLEAGEPLAAQTSIRISRPQGRHGYAKLLGLSDSSSAKLHEQVKVGLPYAALDRLQERLDHDLIDLSQVIHIPGRTLQRRKVEGRLQPDESDRLLRFARILWKTIELFGGDLDAAVGWLVAPVAGLGGVPPLELAQSEPGTLEVEALIGRLEHGVFA